MENFFFSMKINLSLLTLTLTFFLLISTCSNYRLEPINIFISRENFYKDNFNKFTKNLEFQFNQEKGFFCSVKNFQQGIEQGEEIFSIPLNYTYSTFDDFPLKEKIFDVITDNEIIKSSLNLTGNILLTTRILFDLKANVTETFILMKKYENEADNSYYINFNNYKNYLKSRNDFFFNFLKNLPLANIFGQTSWSEDDIQTYELTGFLPVFKNRLVEIYNSIKEIMQKDKILNEFTKNWFNDINLSYFLSIYGYVISRSFKINLKDLHSESNKNLSLINKEIDSFGGSILIPFIELCNHFHPKIDSNDKAKLKNIKFIFNNDTVNIQALSSYQPNEEFKFSYSSLLTNDYLLLNYGFIIRNNPFQEFVFRFDIDDPKFKFYRRLQESGFNIHQIAVIDNEKLAVHFPLLHGKISPQLLQFIKVFLEINNYFENEKHEKIKVLKKLKNSFNEKTLILLKNYMIYFSTIDKNIKSLFDNLNDRSLDGFYEKILDSEIKKFKLVDIIEQNTQKFINSRNITTPQALDDDIQNLFYFKTLQSYIKRNMILNFNFENLKIMYSHIDMALKKMMGIFKNNINDLKKNYVK
jgi:hypothetical protein